MTNDNALDERFMDLASRFLDGALGVEELETLEAIVRKDAVARETLAELLNQHGTLAWSERGLASFKGEALRAASPEGSPNEGQRRPPAWWMAIPVAACFAIIFGAMMVNQNNPKNPGIQDPTRPTGPSPARVQTLTFQDGVSPTAGYRGTRDTRITGERSGTTFGHDPLIEIERSEDRLDSCLIGWDLSAIPPKSRIHSASITIRISKYSGEPRYSVHGLRRPWSEEEATWLTAGTGGRWQLPGARGEDDRTPQLLASFRVTQKGGITVPLNAAGITWVQSWIDQPASNHGFLVTAEGRGGEIYLHTREAEEPENRPELEIRFSPPTP